MESQLLLRLKKERMKSVYVTARRYNRPYTPILQRPILRPHKMSLLLESKGNKKKKKGFEREKESEGQNEVKNGRNPFSLTHIFCKRSSKRRSHGD
jgi:hypothetical protein